MHVDTLHRILTHGGGLTDPMPGAEVSLPMMRSGGLDVQFFALWVSPKDLNPRQVARQELRLFHREVVSHREVTHAKSTADIDRIVKAGRVAALLSLEGFSPLEGDVGAVRRFFDQGVRMASLTWNEDNVFATGAHTRRRDGLSAKGREALRLMDSLGMILDVSHASRASFWDMVVHGKYPFVASHSNAAALHPHRRNLDDVQLWAIGDAGGVVGLNFHGTFLSSGKTARLADVVAHARHLVRVMGAEHVALGSDFDGNIRPPKGLTSVADLPKLSEALAGSGITHAGIEGLLGQNILRVFRAVETRTASPRPRFRPAKVYRAKVRGGSSVKALFDRSLLTSAGGNEPWVLEFETREAGVSRLSVCGRPGQEVQVTLTSSAGAPVVERTWVLPANACPCRMSFPRQPTGKRLHFRLALSAGPLAEVVPEGRPPT